MRVVFIGASNFSVRCLQTCLDLTCVELVGIVSAPQKFSISYRPNGVVNVLHADVGELARAHSIPLLMVEAGMNTPGMLEEVESWKPDLFLVAGWYHMIPRRWRQLAPAFGLHASLLPDYSGGAPLVWAIINGEEKTGITMFQMNDGVDAGPIAGQKAEEILPTDTIATLYERIEEKGLELLRDVLPKYAQGTLKLLTQDENLRRNMPQRSPEDGLLYWDWDSARIERFIRAQTRPYPGAFSMLNGEPIHFWRARIHSKSGAQIEPGFVVRTADGSYVVGCGDGAIAIDEVSYGQNDYTSGQLVELLGAGGQRFGITANQAELNQSATGVLNDQSDEMLSIKN